jgi:tetratricopeptide (TPR) repeat protein
LTGHETPADLAEIDEARTAAQDAPTDPAAWIRLGRLLHEPGHQLDQAVAALNRALVADPTNVAARFWLARLSLLDLFKPEAAKRLLEQALELDPNCVECLSLLISAKRDLGAAPKKVLALAERAIRLAPDWRTPREQLVVALIESGSRDRVRRELSALKMLPIIAVPRDRLEAEFEDAVTGRSRPSHSVWMERVRRELPAEAN